MKKFINVILVLILAGSSGLIARYRCKHGSKTCHRISRDAARRLKIKPVKLTAQDLKGKDLATIDPKVICTEKCSKDRNFKAYANRYGAHCIGSEKEGQSPKCEYYCGCTIKRQSQSKRKAAFGKTASIISAAGSEEDVEVSASDSDLVAQIDWEGEEEPKSLEDLESESSEL